MNVICLSQRVNLINYKKLVWLFLKEVRGGDFLTFSDFFFNFIILVFKNIVTVKIVSYVGI